MGMIPCADEVNEMERRIRHYHFKDFAVFCAKHNKAMVPASEKATHLLICPIDRCDVRVLIQERVKKEDDGDIIWCKCPHCGKPSYPMTLDLPAMIAKRCRRQKK